MTTGVLPKAQTGDGTPEKGYLKIFLGYASGVGKSFRMLDEARRRSLRGQDVVIGAVQPRAVPEVDAILGQLEFVPLKEVGAGTVVDVNALLQRQPAVCFIDGLAYDNPAGSPNKTRWEDVVQLVQAGIKVITSINIQYITELQEQVEAITGKHVTQTVPVAFIRSADEIEIVDAPAVEAHRRSPGELAGVGDHQRQLLRLREMALVLAADVVDHQLTHYLESHGIRQHFSTQERILVCLAADSNAQEMIETAQTVARRFYGEMIVVNVDQPEISSVERAAVDEKLSLARASGVRVEILQGRDPVDTILEFARTRGITQVFVGHSRSSSGWSRLFGNPLNRLVRQSRGMDVRIFPKQT
jgi:two-component system, OmpR family, sensor histidine kinase KdpD